MFGFVTADLAACSSQEAERYRGCYCGLCQAIGRDCGQLCRTALQYDFVFLALLLSSLYEPAETQSTLRCPVHGFRKQPVWTNEFFSYCGQMNVLLTYYSCLDHWHDEKNLLRLAQAQILASAGRRAADRYPRQAGAIRQSLQELACLEKNSCGQPDTAANAFGALMGRLFVLKDDCWQPILFSLGQSLGRFLYLLDAVLDLDRDRRRGLYNPLLTFSPDSCSLEAYQPELTMLLGECAQEFEKLPLIQDAGLLRNILYSGIWSHYLLAKKKQAGNKEAFS